MKCQHCGHENEGGRFCENCGTQLIETTENNTQQPESQTNNRSAGPSQAEDYLQKTKDQSKQYFTYFIDVLKKPYASLHTGMENQHFIHAIITIILYSLFIPLMMYFGIKGIINSSPYGFASSAEISPPFMEIVIKLFLVYAFFILLVVSFTYISIRLGRVNVTFKEVLTRFGILLIPFVFILAVGLILSFLKASLFIYFMGIGLTGAIYIAVPILIVYYKKSSPNEGLDAVYGTLLTYILMTLTVVITGEMLFDSLISGIESYFNSDDSYFGF